METEEQIMTEHEEALIEVQERKFLTFALRNEEYGINIEDVREIIGIQKITEVPDVPVFIKGIINLRGKIIPVMDIRLRFGMPEIEYNERTSIIVVNIKSKDVGLIVDTVSEVLDIPLTDIEKEVSNNTSENYVEAFGKVSDSVKILLDIQKLLEGLSL